MKREEQAGGGMVRLFKKSIFLSVFNRPFTICIF